MLRNKNDKLGRYFEELTLGKIYHHKGTKEITNEEHKLFCKLTMNSHPLHLNEEYAKSSHFGRIVVVGTYIASIVVGISVTDISGKAIANLEYKNIIHHVKVLGNWDLEPEFEVQSESEFNEILKEMKDQYSDIIKNIEIITISKEHKFVYF